MKNLAIPTLLGIFCLSSPLTISAQPYAPPASPRVTYNFNPGWKLTTGDPTNAQLSAFDDSAWKPVTLPHAWNEDYAFQVAIGSLPTGIAWYRKHFVLPPNSSGQKVFLEFEGIRQAGEVYINGQWVGRSENGVMAFGFDITTNLLAYPQDNVVAVRTDNSYSYQEIVTGVAFEWNSSSFYANYGGINKNVWLHFTGKVYQTLPLFSNLGTVGTYVYAQNISVPGRSAVIHAGTRRFTGITTAMFGGLSGSQNLGLVNGSSAAVALTVGGNNLTTTYAGALSGAGSLTKTGTGMLSLSGANTQTGNTMVQGGNLTISDGTFGNRSEEHTSETPVT